MNGKYICQCEMQKNLIKLLLFLIHIDLKIHCLNKNIIKILNNNNQIKIYLYNKMNKINQFKTLM